MRLLGTLRYTLHVYRVPRSGKLQCLTTLRFCRCHISQLLLDFKLPPQYSVIQTEGISVSVAGTVARIWTWRGDKCMVSAECQDSWTVTPFPFFSSRTDKVGRISQGRWFQWFNREALCSDGWDSHPVWSDYWFWFSHISTFSDTTWTGFHGTS